METPDPFVIRPGERTDCAVIVELIHELARFEKLEGQCHPSVSDLEKYLFDASRFAEVLLAEKNGVVAGFALFFHNFSTFLARPGLYLEDLFVRPEHRGKGIGRELLRRLAAIAVERGCGRFEWSVLDWNQPAIAFYEGLGAKVQSDWRIFRMAEADLLSFGTSDPGPGVSIVR